MSQSNLWSIAVEALRTLSDEYLPVIDTEAINQGVDPGSWGLLFFAYTFDPDFVSASRLRVRNPYTAAKIFEDRLTALATAGLLDSNGFGEYRLSGRGKDAVAHIMAAAYERMSNLQPLLHADLERLASLLHRVVQSCMSAPEPPGKWCIGYSRRSDPGEKANLIVRIDQYLTDLNAYHDDAHLAAWQTYGFSALAWEILTLLWRGEANRIDRLLDRLARRGYPEEVYVEVLNDLVERGLAQEDGEIFRLTQAGLDLRQRAEDTTDRSFFAPWECLSPAEQEKLRELLIRFQHPLAVGR